ncbi:MAG: signal peptidase I [Beijerinckiaceae bacterium]|nr:MAG: signal peptidase I [Beijerinckiaceae bacterium]
MTEPTKVKRGGDPMGQAKESSFFGELFKVIIQALAIALIVRTLFFQPFNIPSGSMIPTLLVGDYLFVSKYSYGYSAFSLPCFWPLKCSKPFFDGRVLASRPKRGDVVVFKLPRDNTTDYIKRVIGLPGDKIEMIDGRLYINGTMVPRTPAPPLKEPDLYGHLRDVPTYTETLPGGVKHTIIEVENDHGFYDDIRDASGKPKVFVVPPNHYFMMGDNRDNSTDSRVPEDAGGVGYVPFENLIGRAEVIFFSVKEGEPAWEFWKWPMDVRWYRLFKHVK